MSVQRAFKWDPFEGTKADRCQKVQHRVWTRFLYADLSHFARKLEGAFPRRYRSFMRLRSDIWVSAYLRRCNVEGAFAVLRRRGAPEAGAVFVKIDMQNGQCVLFGPAPQSEMPADGRDRLWHRMHADETIDVLTAEERLRRELSFDPDLWIVEVENTNGRHFLDLAD